MADATQRPLSEVDLKVHQNLGELNAKADSTISLLEQLKVAIGKNRDYQEQSLMLLKEEAFGKIDELGNMLLQEIESVKEDFHERIAKLEDNQDSFEKRLKTLENDKIYAKGRLAAFAMMGGVAVWVANFVYSNFFKN